jgi:hypothetical protein
VTEETSALYREDLGWQELLPDLVDSAIDYEREVRRFVDHATVLGPLDLSPLSLTPARNVHIFVTDSPPTPHEPIEEIGDARVVQRIVHNESRTVALVTQRMSRPPFMRLNVLDVPIYELHLLTWVEEQGILFVSTTTESARRDILQALAPAERKSLSGLQLRRLLEAASLDRYFSIGTRAAQAQATRTSYQMRAGPKTEDDITPADSRQWDLGHGIGRSGTGTFGFSVLKSKIWEPGAADSLFAFRRWCESLARQLADPNLGHSRSKLDLLTISDPLALFPQDPLIAVLPPELYADGTELLADGEIILPELVELRPKAEESTDTQIVVDVWIRDEQRGSIRFNANGTVDTVGPGWVVRQPRDTHDLPLNEILVHEPATIFFANGARVTGDRVSPPPEVVSPVPLEIRRLETWNETDITVEFGQPRDDRLSVGATVANLLTAEMPIVLQDHLPGELADFVAIDNTAATTEVRLVHCKKSSRPTPTVRVSDLEELAAQAIRSVRWLTSSPALWVELRYRLEHRAATRLLNGERDEVEQALDLWSNQPPLAAWSIWIVQPGLSSAHLDAATPAADRATALLTAAHAWVASQSIKFSVICSP